MIINKTKSLLKYTLLTERSFTDQSRDLLGEPMVDPKLNMGILKSTDVEDYISCHLSRKVVTNETKAYGNTKLLYEIIEQLNIASSFGYNKDEIKADIIAAHDKIKELINCEMDLYRAPYGEYNNTVVEAANECGYYIIQWDVDSLDWKEYGKQPLIDKVLKHKNLTYGSIVLLHTGTDYTKLALDDIIKGLKTKGYEIIPTSELIIREEYKCDHTGRQYKK